MSQDCSPHNVEKGSTIDLDRWSAASDCDTTASARTPAVVWLGRGRRRRQLDAFFPVTAVGAPATPGSSGRAETDCTRGIEAVGTSPASAPSTPAASTASPDIRIASVRTAAAAAATADARS